MVRTGYCARPTDPAEMTERLSRGCAGCPSLRRCQDVEVPDPTAALDLAAALDPEQRQAAEALTGPVCILAGAGTGKTRAITYRIA
jgi:hypothetical protein